jgi:methanogenic corrinoid protein MtbC1
MSQFYDQIFSQSRKNLTLLSCAVGSELHEIGVRMLSDIFEYNGWDTFYLGAALPQNAILQAIDEYKPNLIALSVTMPPHLKICEQIIKAIRSKYPDLLIAVGGQAFLTTQELWEKWDVNFYSPSAAGLLILAEEYICLR